MWVFELYWCFIFEVVAFLLKVKCFKFWSSWWFMIFTLTILTGLWCICYCLRWVLAFFILNEPIIFQVVLDWISQAQTHLKWGKFTFIYSISFHHLKKLIFLTSTWIICLKKVTHLFLEWASCIFLGKCRDQEIPCYLLNFYLLDEYQFSCLLMVLDFHSFLVSNEIEIVELTEDLLIILNSLLVSFVLVTFFNLPF